MVRPTPLRREYADPLAALAERRIAAVTYHVLALPDDVAPSGPLRYSQPDGDLHAELEAVDFAFEDGGTATVTWAMARSIEGLALVSNEPGSWHAYEALDVSAHDHWRTILGHPIRTVGAGWQRSDTGVPETLWALRIERGARAAVVALGEVSRWRCSTNRVSGGPGAVQISASTSGDFARIRIFAPIFYDEI